RQPPCGHAAADDHRQTDGDADFVTNSLDSITNNYATAGEYFPRVTIQTTAGIFSSIGGWNAISPDFSNQPIRINVQAPPVQVTFASIPDPVDLKWTGTNLYVLSGSTATITEFDANANVIRSLSNLGSNLTGFDVDSAGNVYVVVTASNQVCRLNPTTTSFQIDTSFGWLGGSIGTFDGRSGTNTTEFNAPFDVAVSPDGQTIAVSDSGNDRIQMFNTNGNYLNFVGTTGNALGQFQLPKGLAYDSVGVLYIVDSGNNRIVMAQGNLVLGTTGTGGTDLGQFSDPVNLSLGRRGVYVADTGNSRIQKLDPPTSGLFSITPAKIRFAIATNFSQPYAVAPVNNFTNDLFYVADKANNRVILCTAPTEDDDALQAVWNNMTNRVAAADLASAVGYFSSASADKYRQPFLAIGPRASLISIINQIGTLTPDYIGNDEAEYFFTKTVSGEIITFPVKFVKEHGAWKISSF
ncbi:MAG: NHL repeat-containing protein, partial [Verrucomicrobiota bacterium]